ncbi:MAG: AAA domain-containing protein [bacterium]|nr:AAA domain-containing protein [bacterium]
MDALHNLTEAIRTGLPGPEGGFKPLMTALFGDRYHKARHEPSAQRDAYALAGEGGGKVPYAGLINPDNPPSGPYGGTSVVWFPSSDNGSLITLVVGTRGLAPDEGILMRPGHRRRVAALRRYLARHGVGAWTKPDPASLGVKVPKTVQDRFPGFEAAFKRYGTEIYAAARVPTGGESARRVVQAFLDLYAYERGWQTLAAYTSEYEEMHAALREDLFPAVDADHVDALLRERRFVILQGPPGTGKTRLANEIQQTKFDGRGLTVQFHPAVTYEDFVIGLTPDAQSGDLRFDVQGGWLLQAVERAQEGPSLLVIDEVNRSDLGKVLGEAIYLFEPGEVGGENAREVTLPHKMNGSSTLKLPENLYVLATMNTADRSIANIDLAVRRRFAFVTMHPDRTVVARLAPPRALAVFDQITDVFVEYAPGDGLSLMPGHAYYLAKDDTELNDRFRYDLIPLLDEYLQQGLLGPATTELHAVRDSIEDLVEGHGG